jgi:hypothetical protein
MACYDRVVQALACHYQREGEHMVFIRAHRGNYPQAEEEYIEYLRTGSVSLTVWSYCNTELLSYRGLRIERDAHAL